ncbi:MAG: hypothetical protein JKY00_04130 [Roseicyclus sp.]|nr:hypothetical protein [Roseicyclus sp.]
MDYGYILLRHIVQQVFGNLGAAARITILPIFLGYAISGLIFYALLGPIFFEIAQQQVAGIEPANPFGTGAEAAAFVGRVFLAFALCLPVLLIFYGWAAVGWHRYVLLDESATGIAARWNGAQIKSYVGAVLRMFLMLFLAGLILGFIVGVILSIAPSNGLAQALTIAMNIAFTWISARIGLVLPSAALSNYMKLGESWAATAPVSGSIMLPIIVIPIGFTILFSVVGFVPVVGIVLIVVLVWLQTLMNLALLTTLYGNLIEGRQLN